MVDFSKGRQSVECSCVCVGGTAGLVALFSFRGGGGGREGVVRIKGMDGRGPLPDSSPMGYQLKRCSPVFFSS